MYFDFFLTLYENFIYVYLSKLSFFSLNLELEM